MLLFVDDTCMVEASDLASIREELETLWLLYKNIADQNISVEEPSVEDIEAIESDEETVDMNMVCG
jgi:hypothetical protein